MQPFRCHFSCENLISLSLLDYVVKLNDVILRLVLFPCFFLKSYSRALRVKNSSWFDHSLYPSVSRVWRRLNLNGSSSHSHPVLNRLMVLASSTFSVSYSRVVQHHGRTSFIGYPRLHLSTVGGVGALLTAGTEFLRRCGNHAAWKYSKLRRPNAT